MLDDPPRTPRNENTLPGVLSCEGGYVVYRNSALLYSARTQRNILLIYIYKEKKVIYNSRKTNDTHSSYIHTHKKKSFTRISLINKYHYHSTKFFDMYRFVSIYDTNLWHMWVSDSIWRERVREYPGYGQKGEYRFILFSLLGRCVFLTQSTKFRDLFLGP